NIIAHQHDVREVKRAQAGGQHVGLTPDGDVGGPGVVGFAIAEHIEGVDGALGGQRGRDMPPGDRVAGQSVQQHDSAIGTVFLALESVAEGVVNRTYFVVMRGMSDCAGRCCLHRHLLLARLAALCCNGCLWWRQIRRQGGWRWLWCCWLAGRRVPSWWRSGHGWLWLDALAW